jgi:hypothetical protein
MQKDNLKEYDEWLKLVEEEDRTLSKEPESAIKAERMGATLQHQKKLEDETEKRFPSVYRKAMNLAPDPELSDRKIAIVPALERGLAKMREAGMVSSSGASSTGVPPPSYPPEKRERHMSEEFDFVDSDEDYMNVDQKTGGKLAADDSPASSPGSGDVKKGRGRGLLRMLRSPAR